MASWVRESILQLGPTFIKLGGCPHLGILWHSLPGPQGVTRVPLPLLAGQLSSTRSDLLPAEFTEELSKLQVWLGAGRRGCLNRLPHLTNRMGGWGPGSSPGVFRRQGGGADCQRVGGSRGNALQKLREETNRSCQSGAGEGWEDGAGDGGRGWD